MRIERLPSLSSDLLIVSFRYTDRYKAQMALRAIRDRVGGPGIEVVDPASLPELGRFRPWHFLAAGILAGIGAGLVRWRRPTPVRLRPQRA